MSQSCISSARRMSRARALGWGRGRTGPAAEGDGERQSVPVVFCAAEKNTRTPGNTGHSHTDGLILSLLLTSSLPAAPADAPSPSTYGGQTHLGCSPWQMKSPLPESLLEPGPNKELVANLGGTVHRNQCQAHSLAPCELCAELPACWQCEGLAGLGTLIRQLWYQKQPCGNI